MKKLMNRKELSEATGMTLWTIGELTRRGTCPVAKIPGMRLYLYDYDVFMKWLDSLQQGTAGQGLRLAK